MLGKSKSPGRPPKSGPGQTRKPTSLLLPPETKRNLAALAKALGVSESDVVIAAIDRAAAEHLKPATSGGEDS